MPGRIANLIKTAQFEELIDGRQLDGASRRSERDAGEAEEYLHAALEEGNPELFLPALRNVAEAQGGVAQLAEKAMLNSESLYKILSERGNPELKSLNALLHALGFRLAVTANR